MSDNEHQNEHQMNVRDWMIEASYRIVEEAECVKQHFEDAYGLTERPGWEDDEQAHVTVQEHFYSIHKHLVSLTNAMRMVGVELSKFTESSVIIQLAKEALEEKLGFEVQTQNVNLGPLGSATAFIPVDPDKSVDEVIRAMQDLNMPGSGGTGGTGDVGGNSGQ